MQKTWLFQRQRAGSVWRERMCFYNSGPERMNIASNPELGDGGVRLSKFLQEKMNEPSLKNGRIIPSQNKNILYFRTQDPSFQQEFQALQKKQTVNIQEKIKNLTEDINTAITDISKRFPNVPSLFAFAVTQQLFVPAQPLSSPYQLRTPVPIPPNLNNAADIERAVTEIQNYITQARSLQKNNSLITPLQDDQINTEITNMVDYLNAIQPLAKEMKKKALLEKSFQEWANKKIDDYAQERLSAISQSTGALDRVANVQRRKNLANNFVSYAYQKIQELEAKQGVSFTNEQMFALIYSLVNETISFEDLEKNPGSIKPSALLLQYKKAHLMDKLVIDDETEKDQRELKERQEFTEKTGLDINATADSFWLTYAPPNVAQGMLVGMKAGVVPVGADDSFLKYTLDAKRKMNLVELQDGGFFEKLAQYIQSRGRQMENDKKAKLQSEDYEYPKNYLDMGFDALSDMITDIDEPKNMVMAGIVVYGLYKTLVADNNWGKAARWGAMLFAGNEVYKKATGNEGALEKILQSMEKQHSGTSVGVEWNMIDKRREHLGVTGQFEKFAQEHAHRVTVGLKMHDISAENLLDWEQKYQHKNSGTLEGSYDALMDGAPSGLSDIYVAGVQDYEIPIIAMGFLRLTYKNAYWREHMTKDNPDLLTSREYFRRLIGTVADSLEKDASKVSFSDMLRYIQTEQEQKESNERAQGLYDHVAVFTKEQWEALKDTLVPLGIQSLKEGEAFTVKLFTVYGPEVGQTILDFLKGAKDGVVNRYEWTKGKLTLFLDNNHVTIETAKNGTKVLYAAPFTAGGWIIETTVNGLSDLLNLFQSTDLKNLPSHFSAATEKVKMSSLQIGNIRDKMKAILDRDNDGKVDRPYIPFWNTLSAALTVEAMKKILEAAPDDVVKKELTGVLDVALNVETKDIPIADAQDLEKALKPVKTDIIEAYGLLRDEDYAHFLHVLTQSTTPPGNSPFEKAVNQGRDASDQFQLGEKVSARELKDIFLNDMFGAAVILAKLRNAGVSISNVALEGSDAVSGIAGFIPANMIDIVDPGNHWWLVGEHGTGTAGTDALTHWSAQLQSMKGVPINKTSLKQTEILLNAIHATTHLNTAINTSGNSSIDIPWTRGSIKSQVGELFDAVASKVTLSNVDRLSITDKTALLKSSRDFMKQFFTEGDKNLQRLISADANDIQTMAKDMYGTLVDPNLLPWYINLFYGTDYPDPKDFLSHITPPLDSEKSVAMKLEYLIMTSLYLYNLKPQEPDS